jgi:hypothetical protein
MGIPPSLPKDVAAALVVKPAPSGIDLIHAMDRVILETAERYNGGGLRVGGAASDERDGVYFSPGIDANPLVKSSNPADIGIRIATGGYDLSTRHGMERFAWALLSEGRISERDYRSAVSTLPSRRVVFVATDTGRIGTWFRPADDALHICSELISLPGESLASGTYDIVSGVHYSDSLGVFQKQMQRRP